MSSFDLFYDAKIGYFQNLSATEEEKKFMQLLAPYFLNAAPDFKGPMQPEQSVEMMRKVIDSVTVAETGAFISHKGNKEWL